MRKSVFITSVIVGVATLVIAIFIGMYLKKAVNLDDSLNLSKPKTSLEEKSIQNEEESESQTSGGDLQDENVTTLLEEGGASPLDMDIDKLDLGDELESSDFMESDLDDLEINEESTIDNEFNI